MRRPLLWGIVVLCAAAALCLAGCAPERQAGRPATPRVAGGAKEAGSMLLTSPAFHDGGALPPASAYSGRNESPQLRWSGPPAETRSFALTCTDLHPIARGWVHWLVVDIPAGTAGLAARASGTAMPSGSRELRSTYGEKGWGGPEPPRGSGVHTYEFVLYALDVATLGVPDGADVRAVRDAMEGHVLASAKLTGTYER